MIKPFVELIRLETFDEGIISAVIIDDEWFCVSLERPWLNNIPNFSCIPTGLYECERMKSNLVLRLTNHIWDETFEVMDVEGRTYIRFHSGCFPYNSKGCILVGSHAGKLRIADINKRAILNSGRTFHRFMEKFKGINSFHLSISNGR